ncbi:MAG TPA: TRAP transporter large permease subunit [Solirubrobacteraceae bacterium]
MSTPASTVAGVPRRSRWLLPTPVVSGWDAGLRALTSCGEVLVGLAVLAGVGVTFYNVCARYLANSPVAWTPEIATICLSVVTFIGGAVALRRGQGMSMRVLIERSPPAVGRALEAAGIGLSLLFVVIVLTAMPSYISQGAKVKTAILGVPELTITIWLAVGFLMIAIYLADSLRKMPWRSLLAGVVICGAIIGLVELYRSSTEGGFIGPDPAIVFGPIAVAAFLAGVQIALVLGLGAMAFIMSTGTLPLASAPVALQTGIASFVMVAIPFFLLAGVLMDKGGLASRLVRMLQPLVSRLPGGLLITEVVAVYIFSGISGSKLADIAAAGSALNEPLAEAGYEKSESAAVLAASAAMSETIPPSLAIIVLSSITTLSVAGLFVAGIIPATVIGLCLIAGIMLRAKGHGYPPSKREPLIQFVRSVPAALPALLLPVILVGGIVGGVATPTEIASVAAVYGFLVTIVVYRRLKPKAAWRATIEASTLAGSTLLILSTATLFSQTLTIDQVPTLLAKLLEKSGGSFEFFVLSLLGTILFGTILEGLPALLILAPILLPIASALGVNDLQYGITLIIAMGIGAFLPPVGAGYIIACRISNVPMEKALRPSAFFNLVLVVGLALVAAIPVLTTFLPKLLKV